MTETEVYAALGDIFAELFPLSDLKLGPDLKAADVAGRDSFRQIEIVMAAEERFGVKFRTRDIRRAGQCRRSRCARDEQAGGRL